MSQGSDIDNANVIRLPNRVPAGNSSRGIEDNGSRKNNFLETSNIEKAKNEESRIAVSSPFKNGKRNSFFLNPTFYTSDDLRRSGDLITKKTPYGTVRTNTEVSPSRKLNFEAKPNVAPPSVEKRNVPVEASTTPKRTYETIEANTTPKRNYNTIDIAPAIPRQNERIETIKPIETQSNYVTEPVYQETFTAPDAGEVVNVCNGCYNRSLANEHLESVRLLKERERELERRALEHDNMLFNNMLQSDFKRKELMRSVSKDNKSQIKSKESARRKSSANLLSADVVKPYTPQKNKSEATINLNLLDKIHENSVKKSMERQENLWINSTHNKNIIDEKERNKSLERVKSESDANGKSLLDRIYDNCLNYLSRRNSEQKHALDFNRSTSKERSRKLERTIEQDPFKHGLEDLNKIVNTNSMLDNLNDSNVDYISRRNRESVERSKYNRDQSQKNREILKNNEEFEDKYTEAYHQSPYKLNINPEKFKSKAARSFLENMYNNASARNEDMNCSKKIASEFNQDQIANHEHEKGKSPMDQYYKTPTKKVGVDEQVDYDKWTDDNAGVFDMINRSAEKTTQERKERTRIYENILKRQMEYKSNKKKEEQTQNANFVESHKILCSHNSNVMYCSYCNRKYPMNKITKMLSHYKKQKNY